MRSIHVRKSHLSHRHLSNHLSQPLKTDRVLLSLNTITPSHLYLFRPIETLRFRQVVLAPCDAPVSLATLTTPGILLQNNADSAPVAWRQTTTHASTLIGSLADITTCVIPGNK